MEESGGGSGGSGGGGGEVTRLRDDGDAAEEGVAAGTAGEGSTLISGTTDATSGETAKTEGQGTTTTTKQTRRWRGTADAPADAEEGEYWDVPRYAPTPEDLRLREVYGDWVHGNPGTHLDGGYRRTGGGRGGGVTLRSCHHAVTTPRAGRWGGGSSTSW